MRISDWAQKFNLAVKRCEERPDQPQGDVVFRVKDIFTTLRGSWDPASDYGAIPQWARDVYLKPADAEDYSEEVGADHNLFALVLDLDGKPIKTGVQIRCWPDGFDKLGDADYSGYLQLAPNPCSGWANIAIDNNFCPENGEQGAWSWCPEGAADVVVGGGMPNEVHVSTFVIWRADRREGVQLNTPPTPTRDPLPAPRTLTTGAAFTISPERVIAGQDITLTWAFAGAQALTLTGPSVTGQGVLTFTLARTGQYTLQASLDDGITQEKSLTVVVDDAPPDPPLPRDPVPPDPGVVTPRVSFTISPERVIAGQDITLTWFFAGAQVLTLTGPSVAGVGALTFTLARTGQYTLKTTSDNGTTSEKSVTVVVDDAPPGPKPVDPLPNLDPAPLPVGTRPPTVVLTAANIARLRSFPRPANDNGRGLHFSIDLRDESIAWTVANLRSIDARWTLIYAQDELQAGRAARACWDAGIMPVMRVGKKINEPCDSIPYVRELKAVGAPPYIQIFNEPSDGREWRNPVPPDALQVFALNWASQAAAVVDAGGYPGLQVLEKEELDAAIDAVAEIKRTDIWERAFFCLHNYGANHPPIYPYDIGKTVFEDFYGVLSFLAFAKWMQERIGFVLPIIGGEGGWQFGQDQDHRYPKAEQPYHARYHKEMFDWFRTGLLSNGETLPDYLFSVTPWIAAGWGADDWWGGVLGTKTETIAAAQAIPPFVRRFSWGS